MDTDRRAHLVEQRRLLQLRRRRQTESATFRTLAPVLCARGVRFSRLAPSRCREALGDLVSGPAQDERLLCDHTAGACRPWRSDLERGSLLRDALARCGRPKDRVAVVWHTHEAGLRLRAADLATNAEIVLGHLHGTVWVVAAAGGPWLIELSYWDQELCCSLDMAGS